MPETAAPSATNAALRLLLVVALVTVYRTLTLAFGHLDLYVDEAQYWVWAQHLTWGYYSKPPVIALLIALTTAIGGNGVFWVKAGALLCYPLSTALLYALSKRLFDTRVALWSAATFLLLPGVSFSSMIISTDVPFFVAWCAALYGFWRALEDDRWRWWLLTAVAAGAGLQTKYTMVLFAPAALLFIAVTPAYRAQLRNPRLYLAMALTALIFLPNVLWNAAHGWPTLHHTESISHLESSPGLHWHHLGDFLGSQFAVMGPLMFGLWLWATLWKPRTWWQHPSLRYLNLFAWVFLGVICAQAFAGRANANWGAMAYASATPFVVARLLAMKRRGWVIAALGINTLLMPVAYHLDWWTQQLGITLTAHTDPYKRVRGWAQLGDKVRPLIAAHPDAHLLGDARDTVSELSYYDRPAEALQWNPGGHVSSQYTLRDTLSPLRGQDFLYIGGGQTLPDPIRARFTGVDDLGSVAVAIHPHYALDYHAWLLHGFQGYAGTAP